ncbi:ATP-binding protein [Lysinibacillus sp. KU-BSD001]|uniref:sensor histidine kinase n=1 Tax=Lysinibacillus sp. KU-BSD001 TaxID=3141328 RepID=UPI0036E9FC6E
MKDQIIGNKIFKYNSFWLLIYVYLILGIYVLYVSFATPFVDIDLKQQDEQWKIESIGYKEWANNEQISIGDIVVKIDGIPIHDISQIQYDPSIRRATELSILKSDGSLLTIDIQHTDIPQQFYMLFVFPSIYFLLALCVSFYLYYFKRHVPYVNFLIYFILIVSLAYISSGASAKLDSIGIIVNSSCLLLCLVLLLNFLKHYFLFLNIKWPFIQNTNFLYIIPLLSTFFGIIRLFYPSFSSVSPFIILALFIFLLSVILFILTYSYIQYKSAPLKILFLGLVVPLLPFLVLFVLPEVLFKQSIVNADICALFLLLIPFNITFIQLTERLFDIVYHVSRFRYYFTLALFITCWLIGCIYFITDIALTKLFEVTLLLLTSITIFLYIKEKIDYRGRKILFSTKGDHIHKLYQTIDKLGKSHRVEPMLKLLTEEIVYHLEVKQVAVITYDFTTGQMTSTNDHLTLIDDLSFQKLSLGEIIRKEHVYLALIHQDTHCKRWLIINHEQTIRLKADELLWLELLLTYTNTFIESTKVIEELVDELQQLRQIDGKEPTWLKKLVWIRVDDEKFQLAQELHDTVLQEHLHIARQVDGLIYETDSLVVQSKLKNLHEQMVISIHSLRAYCETLKPPLLANMGLNAALERLSERTAKRASFTLTTQFDRLYLEDEQLTLVIYRIVQELLNNALKHSQAQIVELYLQELDNGFELIYRDNGIGCNLSDIWHGESMGLQGVQERVEAFNGHMTIDSNMNEGMSIHIKIIERSDVLDFSINSR